MKAKKTYSTSGIILFLLSLVYLSVEFIFNRQLLDISSSVRSDPEQVEHIQYFGRMASGLGSTLLVLGLFQPSGFKITSRKQWVVFSLIALLCFVPFLLTYGQTLLEMVSENYTEDDVPYTSGMGWALLPFIGLYFVLVGKGKIPFAVVLGLVMLAWPAMFYGQKLAVERFIISPTTAEDRLNAHYILLLRSGIEDCVILLEGTQFCDGDETTDVEKRSTRAVMGSLFMLNTTAVFNGLSFSRDQIIDSISAQDMWFSSKEYYQRYLQQVADKREQYEQFLNDKYYIPYKQASDLYLKTYKSAASFYAQAAQPGHFESMTEDAARQVENETEQGWQQYQKAVRDYNNMSVGTASRVEQGVYTKLCNGHEATCDRLISKEYNGMSVDKALTQVQTAAEERFYQQTGYPPDIRNKDDFIRNQKTQDELHTHIEEKIQEQIPDYALPPGWVYDPATFKNDFLHLLQDEGKNKALAIASQAQKTWRDRVQTRFKTNIEPGLSRDDFFKRLGGDPLPPLKDLVMPENDFRKKYIVPINRKIADQALEKIKDEAPSYANKQQLAEQGKDYIRVLYIPAIALCLSVIIVVMTLGRYFAALSTKAVINARMFRLLTKRQRNFVGPVCWAGFLTMALTLPYLWPNPYTATVAYQKYYHLARERSAGTALLLDWVVHVQPIIYRAGAPLKEKQE